MELSERELLQVREIAERLLSLQQFLNSNPLPREDAPVQEWLIYLDNLKQIQGNTSNANSLVATILAKHYLHSILPLGEFDATEKPQGAPGLDIDTLTLVGERVIGEIKTTTPYLGRELGAAQKQSFLKDFAKLAKTQAHHKFFFVTNSSAFNYVCRRHSGKLPNVKVVLLTTGESFDCS